MSEYTQERNAHIRVLRSEIDRRAGYHDPVRDALKWAVKRLEGLPEHWVYTEEPPIEQHATPVGRQVRLDELREQMRQLEPVSEPKVELPESPQQPIPWPLPLRRSFP